MEVMLSMFIFVMIVLILVSVFSKVFVARKSARKTQKNMEEARAGIETIAKNIRMSSKTAVLGAGSSGISMFNNTQQICIEYNFNGGSLESRTCKPTNMTDPQCGNANCNGGTYESDWSIMIADGISGKFSVTPTSAVSGSERIGRATIQVNIDSGGGSTQSMETTVSFRDYAGVIY